MSVKVQGELAVELTAKEKELRDRFVEQYLIDYDELGAAIRIGYGEAYASQYAKQFMLEPYTRQKIAEVELEMGLSTELDKHKHRVIAGLYREANSRFNTGSARVAAMAQISKIMGLDAPVKTEVSVKANEPDMSHLSLEELELIKQKLYVQPPPSVTH